MAIRSRWTLSRSPENMLRFLIVANMGALGASIWSFWQMGKSQDFRRTMRKRFPRLLEFYYIYKESNGYYGIKEKDEIEWSSHKD